MYLYWPLCPICLPSTRGARIESLSFVNLERQMVTMHMHDKWYSCKTRVFYTRASQGESNKSCVLSLFWKTTQLHIKWYSCKRLKMVILPT